ncbi:DUF4240 domain-containing protein [Streptomyces sp. NBC_01589]|uniref:DUF4240 domain-containing protein n=1 Tax=unclassified Streptomyces TaxID=2593676 RepID=UPI00386F2DAF
MEAPGPGRHPRHLHRRPRLPRQLEPHLLTVPLHHIAHTRRARPNGRGGTRKDYGRELSSDSFLYTRAAVVAAGRETYEILLQDPAHFVPYATGLIWAENLLYAPDRAYEHITGEEWDRRTRYSYESCSNTAGWADA